MNPAIRNYREKSHGRSAAEIPPEGTTGPADLYIKPIFAPAFKMLWRRTSRSNVRRGHGALGRGSISRSVRAQPKKPHGRHEGKAKNDAREACGRGLRRPDDLERYASQQVIKVITLTRPRLGPKFQTPTLWAQVGSSNRASEGSIS